MRVPMIVLCLQQSAACMLRIAIAIEKMHILVAVFFMQPCSETARHHKAQINKSIGNGSSAWVFLLFHVLHALLVPKWSHYRRRWVT